MQCAELHGHFAPQELAARVAVLAHKYNERAGGQWSATITGTRCWRT